MTRSYKAARRRARKEPVPFDVAYETTEETEVDGVPTTSIVEKSEHFICKGELSSLLLSEFAYLANVDIDTPEGMALLREFFSQAFGDDAEYQRFFRFQTRYGDDDQLMDILSGLVEDFAARPTERPSDSPASPSTSGQDSKVVTLPGGFTTRAQPVAPELQSAVERMASSS